MILHYGNLKFSSFKSSPGFLTGGAVGDGDAKEANRRYHGGGGRLALGADVSSTQLYGSRIL